MCRFQNTGPKTFGKTRTYGQNKGIGRRHHSHPDFQPFFSLSTTQETFFSSFFRIPQRVIIVRPSLLLPPIQIVGWRGLLLCPLQDSPGVM